MLGILISFYTDNQHQSFALWNRSAWKTIDFHQNKHGGWQWECHTSLLHQQSSKKLPWAWQSPEHKEEPEELCITSGWLGILQLGQPRRRKGRERGDMFKASPQRALDSFLQMQSCLQDVSRRNCYPVWLGWWFRHIIWLQGISIALSGNR